MKNCTQCGKELADEARFCDGCGANFRRRVPREEPPLPGLATINKWTRIMALACVVAGLIVGVMYIFMGGSGKSQTTKYSGPEGAMPYGLRFGMSYEEVVQQLQEPGYQVSDLKPKVDASGYYVDAIKDDGKTADAQLGLQAQYPDPENMGNRATAYYLRFSLDQKLCEFSWVNTVRKEADAEALLQSLGNDYIPQFGIARYQEGEASFTWEDKKVKVTIVYDAEGNTMTLTVHDYTCD